MLYMRLVLDHYIAVFVDIDFRAFSHLLNLLLAPSLLNANLFVHACLEDSELIKLGLGRHAKSTIALRTGRQARPKVRELLYHHRIIAYRRPEITHLLVE